jgi:hypothetical protein
MKYDLSHYNRNKDRMLKEQGAEQNILIHRGSHKSLGKYVLAL